MSSDIYKARANDWWCFLRWKRVWFSNGEQINVRGHTNQGVCHFLVGLGDSVTTPGSIFDPEGGGGGGGGGGGRGEKYIIWHRMWWVCVCVFPRLTWHYSRPRTSSLSRTTNQRPCDSSESQTRQWSWRNLWKKSPASHARSWCERLARERERERERERASWL